jgi:hypothetical protein
MDVGTLQDFVGRTVSVTEEQREMKVEHLKKTRKYVDYKLDPADPVIAEIKALVPGKLRIWLPNTMGTMDFVPTRVNVKIEKNADDAFVVSKVYLG